MQREKETETVKEKSREMDNEMRSPTTSGLIPEERERRGLRLYL
jgi:hypothetical protein